MDGLYKWVSITDRLSKVWLNKRFEPLGLNSSQHMFILNICEREGISQDCLARRVHINRSNVTRALAALERNGFIRREVKASDRRTTRLYSTEKGRAARPEIERIVAEWIAIMTADLSPEEGERVAALMERVMGTVVRALNEEPCAPPVVEA